MRKNIVYHGDCLEVLERIPDSSVNLIYADPPYNLSGNGYKVEGRSHFGKATRGSKRKDISFALESDWKMVDESWDKMSPSQYFEFTKRWIFSCKRVLKDNGSIYISCTYHNLGEILSVLKGLGFKINNVITWRRPNSVPNMTRRVFTHSTEFVVWAVKGKKWRFHYPQLKKINPERQKNGQCKQMRDVWEIGLVQGKERLRKSDGKALHPTQKPEELLRRIVIASSRRGDLVLDPFLGSGTTAVVAKRLGRDFIGIEKGKRYVEAARKRLLAAV